MIEWIAVIDEFPPGTKNEPILTWNYITGQPIIMDSWIAMLGCQEAVKKDGCVSWDRRFSHWAYIQPPTSLRAKKRTRKRRTKPAKRRRTK